MKHIEINYINAKIFGLTILVLFCAYALNAMPTKKSEAHQEIQGAQATPAMQMEFLPLSQDRFASDIKYVSLEEYEEIMRENHINENYIQPDRNFNRKVHNVHKYMRNRNSPLAEHAEYIVILANKFEIDYRLVPAISVIESSAGLKLYRPFNAWGWGGAKGITFTSWEESIYTVTAGIYKGYYAKGANTPEKMGPIYNPHTPNEWATKVNMTMNQIGAPL